MAKTSMVEKEKKRATLAKKYAARRKKLRETVSSPKASFEEKATAALALQKLPRDSAATRGRNRCTLTGRSRGVYRKFGLGRHKLREAAMRGEVPGLKKASW
jgi:small subunit ribosomal protein S14